MPKRISKRLSNSKKKNIDKLQSETAIKMNKAEVIEQFDNSTDENDEGNDIPSDQVKNGDSIGNNEVNVTIKEVKENDSAAEEDKNTKEKEGIGNPDSRCGDQEDSNVRVEEMDQYIEKMDDKSPVNKSEGDTNPNVSLNTQNITDHRKSCEEKMEVELYHNKNVDCNEREINVSEGNVDENRGVNESDNSGKKLEDGEISKECSKERSDQNEMIRNTQSESSTGVAEEETFFEVIDTSDGPAAQQTDQVEMGVGGDKGHLLVTWKDKRVKIPCQHENIKDLNYYNRQLNIIAYPIVLSDLYDPQLSQALTKACEVSLKLEQGTGRGLAKGYLRMRFKIRPHVEVATAALKALPPFEDAVERVEGGCVEGSSEDGVGGSSGDAKSSSDAARGGDAGVGRESEDGVDENIQDENDEAEEREVKDGGREDEEKQKENEAGQKEDEAGQKEDEKNDLVNADTKEETKVDEVENKTMENPVKEERKRIINIRQFLGRDSEEDTMNVIRATLTYCTYALHRLLFVANLSAETTEDDVLEEFESCERVIIPSEQQKAMGYAYVEYVTMTEAKRALEKFKESSKKADEWFVIPAISETSDYFGLVKEEERRGQLDEIKQLQEKLANETDDEDKKSIEKKLLQFKRLLMVDNIRRQKLGLFVSPDEMFEDVMDKIFEKDSKERRPYMGRNFIKDFKNIKSQLSSEKDRVMHADRNAGQASQRGFRGSRRGMGERVYYRNSRGLYAGARRGYGSSVMPLMAEAPQPYMYPSSPRYPPNDYHKSTYPKSDYVSEHHHTRPKHHYHSSEARHYSEKIPSEAYESSHRSSSRDLSTRVSSHDPAASAISISKTISRDPHLAEQLKDLIESLPSDKIKEINEELVQINEERSHSRGSKTRGSGAEGYEDRRVEYAVKRSRDYAGKGSEYRSGRFEGHTSSSSRPAMPKEYASGSSKSNKSHSNYGLPQAYQTSRSYAADKYDEGRKRKRGDDYDPTDYRPLYKSRVGKYGERYS